MMLVIDRGMSSRNTFVSLLDDPLGAFSQVLKNVLHVEDIKSYIHCKIEIIGDDEIHRDLDDMCNDDLSLKSKFMHLEKLNLVKYILYIEFDNHEWTQIILSRVHDDIF